MSADLPHGQGKVPSVKRKLLEGKASLSNLRRMIRADLTEAGVRPAQAFDCLVAVTEAATNALVHGRDESGEAPSPEVAWEVKPSSGVFEVRDYSDRPWRVARRPPANGDPREGGYGLEIMRGLMDEVEIDAAPRGTTVTLVKRFRP
jgi:serine/threonine-protein kinase RsbW